MSAHKWDLRFLRLAREVSTWSKDPSKKVGAVLARPDKTIASLGFNGFPRQMADRPEYLADRETKYSRIIHAEMNALLHAREPVTGYAAYTWPFGPCDRCIVHLLQAGVALFVFPEPSSDVVSRWGPALAQAKQYIEECGARWYEVKRNHDQEITEWAASVPSI